EPGPAPGPRCKPVVASVMGAGPDDPDDPGPPEAEGEPGPTPERESEPGPELETEPGLYGTFRFGEGTGYALPMARSSSRDLLTHSLDAGNTRMQLVSTGMA